MVVNRRGFGFRGRTGTPSRCSPGALNFAGQRKGQFYVQGRQKLDTRQPCKIKEVLDFFRWAPRKESTYALAWLGLADAVALSNNYGYVVPASTPSPIAAARRAMALDFTMARPMRPSGTRRRHLRPSSK